MSLSEIVYLQPNNEHTPVTLPNSKYPQIAARGNLDILKERLLALFCSVRCPGELIIKTYDLANTLRDAGIPVIGGFHSPMEKECLNLLLRGKQPIVICPARSLDGMRLPTTWRTPLAEGRLLLLSPFTGKQRRATAALAFERNEFVAVIADKVFAAYAEPGSKTEELCRKAVSSGKTVLTLESGKNANLNSMGARFIPDN